MKNLKNSILEALNINEGIRPNSIIGGLKKQIDFILKQYDSDHPKDVRKLAKDVLGYVKNMSNTVEVMLKKREDLHIVKKAFKLPDNQSALQYSGGLGFFLDMIKTWLEDKIEWDEPWDNSLRNLYQDKVEFMDSFDMESLCEIAGDDFVLGQDADRDDYVKFFGEIWEKFNNFCKLATGQSWS